MKHLYRQHNELDEMQQQKLLLIESRGFWLAFWALAAAVTGQYLWGVPQSQLAGEAAVLLLVSLYVGMESLRCGIWSHANSRPGTRSNLLISLAVFVVMTATLLVRNSHESWWKWSYWMGPVVAALCGGVVCFVILQWLTRLYYRRRARLDRPEEDQEYRG